MTRHDSPAPQRHLSTTRAQLQSFGLLELATACAALVIVLGSAVSLARFVRGQDSAAAFHEQLGVLNRQLDERGVPESLIDFAPAGTAVEEELHPASIRESAQSNADTWAAHLNLDATWEIDPWGSPVVLIDGTHPELGMAPRLAPFFMSAGPDKKYFTVVDNIYGYDTYLPHVMRERTRVSGGHRE